jgi:hypothetical protein
MANCSPLIVGRSHTGTTVFLVPDPDLPAIKQDSSISFKNRVILGFLNANAVRRHRLNFINACSQTVSRDDRRKFCQFALARYRISPMASFSIIGICRDARHFRRAEKSPEINFGADTATKVDGTERLGSQKLE